MSPMVVLGSRDAVPGRYWGEGEGPAASPSQASLLLARINSRARQRKGGTGQGRLGVRQGKEGDIAEIPITPEHRSLAIQDAAPKEGIRDKLHKDHSGISLIEPREKVEPRVNGVKEHCTAEVEDVKKRKKKYSEEERKGVPEVTEMLVIQEDLFSSQKEGESVEAPITKKKKKKTKREGEECKDVAEVTEILARQEEGLFASQKEEESGEALVTKKKKKKRKREEEEECKGLPEVKEVMATQNLFTSQKEEESGEAPITKKKKKKREEEESQREEKGKIESEIEEVNLTKKKKKKKRHKEDENEEEEEEKISIERKEGDVIKIKKKKKHEEIINDERLDDLSETYERKKKKRNGEKGEEEREKTIDNEMQQSQTQFLNISQQNEEVDLASPRKKKKRDKKLEVQEESLEKSESSQDISSFKMPNIRIKEEITDTLDKVETEYRTEEHHVDTQAVDGVKGETGLKGDQKAVVDRKAKKKQRKQKNKKKNKEKKTEIGGFTLLTEVEATKRQKIQRTLPHWLANPTVIGRDLMADGAPVDSLTGLDPSLTALLKQHNIPQLFPVQRAVIPEILANAGALSCRYRPRDVCVSAPTGSGKTLAYVLPLVQALKSRTVPRIRALVLLPVQELATQVYHVFQSYTKGTSLRVGKAVGHSVLQKEQAALVGHHLDRHHSLVDILVATPGRLADHLRMTRGLDLSALRYLVLDEADRMLAAEGGDWVSQVQRAIADHQANQENQPLLQPPMQRLLFSATLSSDPEQLQHVTLHHPKLFTVAAAAAGQDKSVAVVMGQFIRPAELREEFVLVEEEVKPLALHHLLVSGEGRQRVLVFTNSVQATHKLALLLAALSEGSTRVVAEFSSKRDKRQQILSQFAAGKIDVLVSSDAMARGLDVPDIDHVVSYDVTAPTTYVHRIGRTARAGRPGTALSLVTKTTITEFRRGLSGRGDGASQLTLDQEELESYEQQYIDALASLKKTLEEEERQKRLNHPNGKAKKIKKNKRQRQRKQKKDMRTARRALKRSNEGKKRKLGVNANRLRH